MENDKIYYPETIQDNPFPADEGSVDTGSQTQTGAEQIYTPKETPDNALPRKIIARETISASLNTKSRKILAEFEFTEMGGIRVGKYQNAVSGEITISPNGIVGKNQEGRTTFTIDGTTGDATFGGTLETGTLIAGEVFVGDNNIIIDGNNRRIIINDGYTDRVLIGYGPGLF